VSLVWHSTESEGTPRAGAPVVVATGGGYDVAYWREWMGGYWTVNGELKLSKRDRYAHWAYLEGPP
jgi:hypothetical protein